MTTFLLSTDGTHGDVLPFIRIGQGLIERGHDVTLHTHQFYESTSRRAGVGFVATDSEEAYAHQMAQHGTLLINVLASVQNIADFYREAKMFDQLRRQYEAMADVIRRRGPDQVVVVGRHSTGLSTLMARESFGVPAVWVALYPGQHHALPLTERLFANSIAGPVNELRSAVGLSPVDDWSAWLSSVDLSLGLWPHWYDVAGAATPETIIKTGFVLNDEAETGELAPDIVAMTGEAVPMAQRPVLITGGSSRSLHRDWYRAAIEGCAKAGRVGIVACRHRDLLPEVLPDAIHWYPSLLPFRSLMPHVAAVVHHGGVLTCGRGIASGVPQVVLAFGTDHPDNGRRLRSLGAGEWLPLARWTSEGVAAALSRVLDDAGYRKRTERLASLLDSRAAVTTVCEQLEALVGTGRASAASHGAYRRS